MKRKKLGWPWNYIVILGAIGVLALMLAPLFNLRTMDVWLLMTSSYALGISMYNYENLEAKDNE